MNKEASPNFFIIGAPKCGTSALSRYLSEHTNVYLSKPKEPYYFADDYPKMRELLSGIDTFSKYLGLFKDVGKEHLAIGEASTIYLYSSDAPRNIFKFNPQSQIIVMVRNPIELVQSFHSQLLRFQIEDQEDFETAWKLQKFRIAGSNLPRNYLDIKLLQYSQWGKMGERIEKLFDLFKPEQVKIVIFDEFTSDTRKVYNDVLSFLNVKRDDRADFLKINPNAKYRFPKVAFRLIQMRRSSSYRRISGMFRALTNIGPYELFDKLNRVEYARKPLTNEFRKELSDEFENDVKLLSTIVDKNLDAWLE